VSVANALGSGLVESPAFLPFLPSLAMHLLGEELRLPSVDTWWCGQVRARREVEERLEPDVPATGFFRSWACVRDREHLDLE